MLRTSKSEKWTVWDSESLNETRYGKSSFLIIKISHGLLFHLVNICIVRANPPGLLSKSATQAIDGAMGFEMVNSFATLFFGQNSVSWTQRQTSSVSVGVDVVVCHMRGRDALLFIHCWWLGCLWLPFRLGLTDLIGLTDLRGDLINLCLGRCLSFRPGSCFPLGSCFLLGCCCLPLGRWLALSSCTLTSGLCSPWPRCGLCLCLCSASGFSSWFLCVFFCFWLRFSTLTFPSGFTLSWKVRGIHALHLLLHLCHVGCCTRQRILGASALPSCQALQGTSWMFGWRRDPNLGCAGEMCVVNVKCGTYSKP